MDQEVSSYNSMFSSLLHYEFSFTSQISPEKFCSCLMKQMQENLYCQSLPVEKNDVKLIVFSALMELLEISNRNHSPDFPRLENYNYFCSPHLKADNMGIRNKILQKDKENLHDWFTETHKILWANNKCILHTMVNALQRKSCKFLNFISRKILVGGLKTGFFQMENILQSIEIHLRASKISCTWFIELLKDLVSYALQGQNEIGSTLSWFEQHCILQKLSYGLKTGAASLEHLEHLLLLQKLTKLGMACLNSDGDSVFLNTLFCQVLFPNFQILLSCKSGERHSAICLQMFKIMDTFLSTEWLHPDQEPPLVAMEILEVFHSQALDILDLIQSCRLLIDISFTGKQKKARNVIDDEFHLSSSMLRCVIVVFLKSCALSFQKGQGSWNFLLPFLQVFETTSLQPIDDSSVQKWCISHFADQDNHWISSLLSLLLIYQHIQKSDIDFLIDTASGSRRGISCSEDFLLIFCPHRLFLCFAEFINYDYLVLSDFLISPETSFLPYFLTYLHHLLEDWRNFQSIMVYPIKKPCLQKNDFTSGYETHNMIKSNHESLNGNSFDTQPIGKNFQSSQISVQIVSYSDSDTDVEESPPLSKRRCLQTQRFLEQNHNKGCESTYFECDNVSNDKLRCHTDVHGFQGRFDRVMGMIIRLRMHMSRLGKKGLFPYRAKPLIKLLKACEDKYEN